MAEIVFFLLKVQVVDVVSRDRCVCQTEEGRLLEGWISSQLLLANDLVMSELN